jgi:predicted DNA-binding ribbon-helix-helix protein
LAGWVLLRASSASRKAALGAIDYRYCFSTLCYAARQHDNLSSAIRLFVLGFYRDQCQRRAALDASMSQSAYGFRPS